jgi:hypothetical protein
VDADQESYSFGEGVFITKIAEVEAHKHISPEVASAGYEEDIKHDENLWSDLSRSTRSDRR